MGAAAAEAASPAVEPAAAPGGAATRFLTASLILLVFLSFFQNGLTVLVNVKLRFIGFLILAVLFYKGLAGRPGPLRGYEKAMLAWLGYGTLLGLANFRFGLGGNVAYAIIYNLIFEFCWIMAYFAGRHAAHRGADMRRLMAWTLAFAIVLTSVAIVEKFFHQYIELYLLANSQNQFLQENFDSVFRRGYGYDEAAYRCVSFVLEFIAFSYLCALLSLLFLVLFLEYRRPWHMLGLITSVSALFLTQALSSLAAFCICALVYLVLMKRMRISHLAYLGITALVFAGALSLLQDGPSPFEGILNRLDSAASGKDQGLITHFQDFRFGVIDNFQPFGHGLGTADFLHSLLGNEMRAANYPTIEHEYYRVLFEVGGFGFLIYLSAVFLAFKHATAIYHREADPWRKCLAAICVLWFVMNALVGFAHRSFPTYESSILPALLLGLLSDRMNASSPTVHLPKVDNP